MHHTVHNSCWRQAATLAGHHTAQRVRPSQMKCSKRLRRTQAHDTPRTHRLLKLLPPPPLLLERALDYQVILLTDDALPSLLLPRQRHHRHRRRRSRRRPQPCLCFGTCAGGTPQCSQCACAARCQELLAQGARAGAHAASPHSVVTTECGETLRGGRGRSPDARSLTRT